MNNGTEQRSIAMLVHLSGIFFGFLPSLIIYLVKKDDAYLCDQAKEALNFQITVLIGMVASMILSVIVIGLFTMMAVGLGNLVLCIIAAVKTNSGEDYRYPLTLRLIK